MPPEIPSASSAPASATTRAVSSGPVTNATSIVTESKAYAVRRRAGSETSVGHSERRTAPAGGKVEPATSAASATATSGAPPSPRTQIETSAIACTSASGKSIRVPRLSTRRAASGEPIAVPSASAPVASPALAKEPVTSRTKSTTASPSIPIGSRASVTAAVSTATPGVRRSFA